MRDRDIRSAFPGKFDIAINTGDQKNDRKDHDADPVFYGGI